MIATGKPIPVQYKKAHKIGGGTEPLILNLGLSLHPGAKPEPHSRYGRSEKERSFAPAEIRIPYGPAQSLVTIVSKLRFPTLKNARCVLIGRQTIQFGTSCILSAVTERTSCLTAVLKSDSVRRPVLNAQN